MLETFKLILEMREITHHLSFFNEGLWEIQAVMMSAFRKKTPLNLNISKIEISNLHSETEV